MRVLIHFLPNEPDGTLPPSVNILALLALFSIISSVINQGVPSAMGLSQASRRQEDKPKRKNPSQASSACLHSILDRSTLPLPDALLGHG